MNTILVGCEFAGKTTLANEIVEWSERNLGGSSHFHDHFTIPSTELGREAAEEYKNAHSQIKEMFQRESSVGPGVAHPSHRLPQEVGGAAGGVGPALAQPGHQHVSGAGGDGQQRVVAPLAGIAVVAGALLGQSVGLADGGVQVNGQGPVAGSRPGLPSPGQQLAAHPVELTDVAPPEAAQEGAQGGAFHDDLSRLLGVL